MLGAQRVGRADLCAVKRLPQQASEVCGLAKVDEAAERAIGVGRRRVDQDARLRLAVLGVGIDALADARRVVAAVECELADEQMGDRVEQREAPTGEVGVGIETTSRAPATMPSAQLGLASLRPRPQRPAGPPILIGGNGEKRTLPLVARYANEWNGVYLPPARYRALNQRLDELLTAAGRQPSSVRRSLMTRVIFGRTDAAVHAQLESNQSMEALRERGVVVGTTNAVVEQLGKIAEAGAQRVMLQWMDLDDLDGLAALAEAVL